MSKVITVQRYDNNIQLFFHITNNGTEVETHYLNGTVLSTLDSPMTLVVTPEIVDQDGSFEENSTYGRERQQAIEQPPQRQRIVEEKPQRREQPSVVQFL